MKIVLVGVAADTQLAGVLRRLHDPTTGIAGGVENNVGTATDLALGEFAAFRGIIPRGGRGAGHVLENLGLRIHELRAVGVALGKLTNQRNIHAADETHLARLRSERGGHATEKGRFLFAEVDRLDVRQIHGAVDDRELHVREFLSRGLDGGGLGEANGDDDLGAALRKAGHRLFALGGVGDLKLADLDAGFLFESDRTVTGRLIERLVELAAHVVNDRGREIGRENGRREHHGRDEDGDEAGQFHWAKGSQRRRRMQALDQRRSDRSPALHTAGFRTVRPTEVRPRPYFWCHDPSSF